MTLKTLLAWHWWYLPITMLAVFGWWVISPWLGIVYAAIIVGWVLTS